MMDVRRIRKKCKPFYLLRVEAVIAVKNGCTHRARGNMKDVASSKPPIFELGVEN